MNATPEATATRPAWSCWRIVNRCGRELRRVAAYGSVGYAGVLLFVLAHEPRDVFPGALRQRPSEPPSFSAEWTPVTLLTRDGVRLSAHEWASAGKDSRWCIFFEGQWGRVRWDVPKLDFLRKLDLNVLVFDYRGYGASGGTPSEAGLYHDADAALRHLVEERKVPPAQIVLYGHSLGSAVALDLASRTQVGAVIVDGTFTSLPACAQRHYPWLPLMELVRNRFESLAKVHRITAPKLFLHGIGDETVPLQQARMVYAAAAQPKLMCELAGGHNDFQWCDEHRMQKEIAAFLSHPPAAPEEFEPPFDANPWNLLK